DLLGLAIAVPRCAIDVPGEGVPGHGFAIDDPGEGVPGHGFAIDDPGEGVPGHGFTVDDPGEGVPGHGFAIDDPGEIAAPAEKGRVYPMYDEAEPGTWRVPLLLRAARYSASSVFIFSMPMPVYPSMM